MVDYKYLPKGYSGKVVIVGFSSGYQSGTGEQLKGGIYAIPADTFSEWRAGKKLIDKTIEKW